ncbi:hypothetical protein WN943_008474 [Citrus x changshan-huyou]
MVEASGQDLGGVPAEERIWTLIKPESASHRPSAEQKPAKRFTPSEILIGKEAVFAGEENFSPVTRPFFFFDWKALELEHITPFFLSHSEET